MRTIPEHHRQNLPRILKQLGMTQKDLADALEISAGAVSKYLSIGSNHARLRPERLERLVQVLKDRLAPRSTEEAPGQLAAMALTLSEEAARALKIEIDGLLVEEDEAEPPRGPVFAMPGGAVPLNAINYVEREADREIHGILTAGQSPASIVVAPINGGASSFLNRVYKRANEIPNCWAKIVHFDTAFAEGEEFTQHDLFRFLFRRIGVDRANLKIDADVFDMKFSFEGWALDEWSKYSVVVLIIDGLDQVFRNAGSVIDAVALVNWLGDLRNQIASGKKPYDKLILFTALSGTTWTAANASPFPSQAATLPLEKFTAVEVQELFDRLDIDSSRYSVNEIVRLFAGHPFLTHRFAWSMHRGSNIDRAKHEALNLEAPYEMHWERMKTDIQFRIGKNSSLEKVLRAVLDLTEGGPTNTAKSLRLAGESDHVPVPYLRDLRILGLVDSRDSSDSICEFYRNAIRRDLGLTADEASPPIVKAS